MHIGGGLSHLGEVVKLFGRTARDNVVKVLKWVGCIAVGIACLAYFINVVWIFEKRSLWFLIPSLAILILLSIRRKRFHVR